MTCAVADVLIAEAALQGEASRTQDYAGGIGAFPGESDADVHQPLGLLQGEPP